MIIFYDTRDRKIIGTIDGRVHDDEFTQKAMISSTTTPEEFVGKIVVPTKPLTEIVEVPVIEQFANPENGFKIEERQIGIQQVERVVELGFDVPYRESLERHEDPTDPLQLVKCEVVTDETGNVIAITDSP